MTVAPKGQLTFDGRVDAAPISRQARWIKTPQGRAYIKRWRRTPNARASDSLRQQRQRDRKRMLLGNEEYLRQNRERMRAWREAPGNRRRVKHYSLRWLYGITIDEFEAKLAEQHGLCAICQDPLDLARGTVVDHDHQGGKARGILCGACNLALGGFGDNAEIIQRAVNYLKRWSQCQ
jgi:Recombination endonuclease VII